MGTSIYLKTIKTLLKSRKIKYSQLAESLKMSESGIKKMLSGKDLSLVRLSQIAKCLNIQVLQIVELAEKKTLPIVQLTALQEKLLMTQAPLLKVYWRFAIEGMSIQEISQVEHLDSDQVVGALEKLVRADLIKKKGRQLMPIQMGKFRFDDNSPLIRKLNKEWSELTLSRSLSEQGGFHRLITTKMSRKHFEAIKNQLDLLAEEVARMSQSDEASEPQKTLVHASCLICLVDQGVLDSKI